MSRLVALRGPLTPQAENDAGAAVPEQGAADRSTAHLTVDDPRGLPSTSASSGWVPSPFEEDRAGRDDGGPNEGVPAVSIGRHRSADDGAQGVKVGRPVADRSDRPAGGGGLRRGEGGRRPLAGGWVPGGREGTARSPAGPPLTAGRGAAGSDGEPPAWTDRDDDEWFDAGLSEPGPHGSAVDTDVDVDDWDDDLDEVVVEDVVENEDGADDVDEETAAPKQGAAASTHNPLGVRRVGRHWGRFAELWVPESLRDSRVDPGRRGALILLLVAALAASVTAVGVWRDRPEPRAVETSAIAALAGAPESTGIGSADLAAADRLGAESSAAGAAGPPPPTVTALSEIVVSVTGLVAQPGLVTLPAGARVAEAIAAAGGASEGADLTGVNLAARLVDGDSVVIGSAPASGSVGSGVSGAGGTAGASGGGASAAAGLVNLNTADEAALDTLPGVGPVMAQNILAWRETNGKFTTIEQLQEISGIGPSRYAQLSPLVTVS